ncbi:MAG TPA: aldolase/citrate lyase family protein, partial [Dehalococcoidia bacterium]
MYGNPIRAAVQRREVLFGTWINLVRNPAILPLLKASGLDFARLDMEHSSPSIESVADMALLARAIEFPIFVRPPEANREWITRLLDVGVWNLHCPQVDTAEQAAEIVQAAYYAPMGSRGQAGNGPAKDYETHLSMAERMAYANSQV